MANISKTTTMSIRVDKNLKKEADILFKKLGLNTSVALNMFLNQCILEQGIPFIPSLEVPNARLISAIDEADDIMSGKKKTKVYNSFNDLVKDIDSEI